MNDYAQHSSAKVVLRLQVREDGEPWATINVVEGDSSQRAKLRAELASYQDRWTASRAFQNPVFRTVG